MMSTFLIFILITTQFFIHPSHSIELQCRFRRAGWWDRPTYYECEDTQSIIENENDAIITGINGTHMTGKSNNDVLSFYTYRKTIRIFPKGLENFFKNLEIIAIVNEKMREIHQFELKSFVKLRVLYLDSNEIEILESELFKYNLNLEAINFSNNRIRYVDVSVFKQLQNLKYLWFENNQCHSNKVSNSSVGVHQVIEEIRERCFVDNVLINLQNFHLIELKNLRNEIALLKSENSELKKEIDNLKIENGKTEVERNFVKVNYDKCDKELSEVRADLKICYSDLRNLTSFALRST